MSKMSTVELQIADRALSESNYRGTGCGKSARPGLWGSGEATNRSTRRKIFTQTRMIIILGVLPSTRDYLKKQTIINR
jgi:hypothetical protein